MGVAILLGRLRTARRVAIAAMRGSMKALLILVMAGAAFAQTRSIVPEEVMKARPQPKAEVKANAPKPVYRPAAGDATNAALPAAAVQNAVRRGARQIGVTIWRLRPAAASDSGARILVQEESQTTELVPERVAGGSSLKQGDRVRLSIESPDSGYLYVINRERYSSGERGDPYLIFPTSRTHGGDNKVTGGKLIDIPAQDDRPNFFTLRSSRPDQSEEELTVLLTKEPLPGVRIGSSALSLTHDQVAAWEKQWGGTRTELFELSGGAGKTWTQAEQQAGSSMRLLTQEDPAPQTVYRVAVRPEDPLMVRIHLRFGR
jgi:hypothetical protein